MKKELNVNDVADALRKVLGVDFLLIEGVTVRVGATDHTFRVGPGGILVVHVDIRRE